MDGMRKLVEEMVEGLGGKLPAPMTTEEKKRSGEEADVIAAMIITKLKEQRNPRMTEVLRSVIDTVNGLGMTLSRVVVFENGTVDDMVAALEDVEKKVRDLTEATKKKEAAPLN